MTVFVKFAVIGNARLGHNANDGSSAEGNRAIIQSAVLFERSACKYERTRRQGLCKRCNALFGSRKQGALIEQVAAGVARYAQFREDYQLCATLRRLFCRVGNIFHVEINVRHPYFGGSGTYFDKTVAFHAFFS